MNKKQLWQYIGAGSLLALSMVILFWAFTRSDLEPMILSEATLEGKVTYRGKAVPHALIIVSGENSSSSGQADAEGNFSVPYAPVGKVRIGVNTVAGRGMMQGAFMAAAMSGDRTSLPSFVDVPEKYFAPETSEIAAEVTNKKGLNRYDIAIK